MVDAFTLETNHQARSVRSLVRVGVVVRDELLFVPPVHVAGLWIKLFRECAANPQSQHSTTHTRLKLSEEIEMFGAPLVLTGSISREGLA